MLEVSLPPSLQLPNTQSDTINTDNTFQVRFLGSHMVESDARLDELLQNSSLRAHPTRCTPREGFNLGKLASYAICQELIRNQPTRILFVSLPGHGTATGGRHVGALLRNISQLVLTHLEREDSELIIDGAAGNPAWQHPGLDAESSPTLEETSRLLLVQQWCTIRRDAFS